MVERTTVRLPEELLARARRKAAAEGRTLTSLIEQGLQSVIAERKPKQRPSSSLPVSSATGGMRPGMENMSYSELVELEDLEYIERLKRGFE
jgi:hypothetical protein